MLIKWYEENYYKYIVNVEESEILSNDESIQGYAFGNIFNKKFNYHNLDERKIIIHALSQIPISLEVFKKRQELDEQKRQYCKNNSIKLIEIPYWDYDNIENILNKVINNE